LIAAAFVAIDNTTVPSNIEILACSLYASWHPAEVYIDTTTDSYIHSPTINNPKSQLSSWFLSDQAEPGTQNVQLDVGWANLALPPDKNIAQLNPRMVGEPSFGWVKAFGSSLSLLVTDAMARLGMDSKGIFAVDSTIGTKYEALLLSAENVILLNISEVDMGNTTAFDITQFRYGYSYSMSGSTRRLSVSVLLTHVLIALIHTALVVRYGWRCPDLKCLCNLLVLATNSSRGPTLETTREGIAPPKPYN
jgi:hypothetical protein